MYICGYIGEAGEGASKSHDRFCMYTESLTYENPHQLRFVAIHKDSGTIIRNHYGIQHKIHPTPSTVVPYKLALQILRKNIVIVGWTLRYDISHIIYVLLCFVSLCLGYAISS